METGRIERARLESAPMRNRARTAALRNFKLEAAALLSDDLRAGAEVEFDVIDEGGPRGRRSTDYQPRIHAFVESRWERLRELPSCPAACREPGAGASSWLRMNGSRGEQAEPALQAMLERLYEDATSFGFPEERFERVYSEVEGTLYRDAVRARARAARRGLDGRRAWSLAAAYRSCAASSPRRRAKRSSRERRRRAGAAVRARARRDRRESIPAAEAAERFASVACAMRLWAPGQVGWSAGVAELRRRAGRQCPSGRPRGAGGDWHLPAGEERPSRLLRGDRAAEPPRTVAWALGRFEMGCGAPRTRRRSRLPARLQSCSTPRATPARRASRCTRRAAPAPRREAAARRQRRVEAALALERFVMGGGRAPARSRSRRGSWWPSWRGTCARCCATCSAATSTRT